MAFSCSVTRATISIRRPIQRGQFTAHELPMAR